MKKEALLERKHLVCEVVQSISSLADAVGVGAIQDENEAVRALEVVVPQASDSILATHIPHRELHVLKLDRLHVKPCSSTSSQTKLFLAVQFFSKLNY